MQSLNPASFAPTSSNRITANPSTLPQPMHDLRDVTRRPPNQELPTPSAVQTTAPGARPAGFLLPIDVSSRFGARLRELRRERNLTQLKMATDFGIDRSFISDVERGRKSISLPMLEVIALGMKMSLSDLLQNI